MPREGNLTPKASSEFIARRKTPRRGNGFESTEWTPWLLEARLRLVVRVAGTKMSHRSTVLSVALAVCLLAGAARAQGPDQGELTPLGQNSNNPMNADSMISSITGSVRTMDNNPVPNARVDIRDLSTGRALATGYSGPAGNFALDNVPSGTYEVVATSGLSEAREQIHVDGMSALVSLRMPKTEPEDARGATISVAAMRIPNKAKNELKKARDAMQKGKQDVACEHLAKALQIAPNFSDALTLRGLIAYSDGNLQAASEDLDKAIKADNNNAMAYVAMGSIYNAKNDFDSAISELNRGISLNPTAWQAYFEMGRAELGKGDYDSALRQATTAEQMGGKAFAPIHLVKGHAFLGLKAYGDAVSEFEKFLDTDKNSPESSQVRQELQQAEAFTTTARR